MGWEAGSDYRLRTNLNLKVLDFVQFGGPDWELLSAS